MSLDDDDKDEDDMSLDDDKDENPLESLKLIDLSDGGSAFDRKLLQHPIL